MFDDLDNNIRQNSKENQESANNKQQNSAQRFNAQLTRNQAEEDAIEKNSEDLKRIAPLPPVITKFDEKIKILREKGKKRGRRYSIIGISASIFICAAVIYGGYYILMEVFAITDKMDNKNPGVMYPIEDPGGRCSDDCCLSSLLKIKKNGYSEIDQSGFCPESYEKKQLDCKTSLIWCELIPAINVKSDGLDGSGEAVGAIVDEAGNIGSSTSISLDQAEDLDADGLVYEEEIKYGTDPLNPDTDNDGYSDGDEVKNGYNPLGEGKLMN
ncbi:MAG: thrombospondin type 3 repeat-containing protein [Patescibacteria group bacterium]|nr:thrombospondin type 3 repeat-containing protein [Patescibacteria group bacterium]